MGAGRSDCGSHTTHPRTHAPGAQLILAPPDKIAELLIVSVVVVLDSEQHGGRDFHQRVVGSLLLLAAGVPIVQIVDLVGYLWGEEEVCGHRSPDGRK